MIECLVRHTNPCANDHKQLGDALYRNMSHQTRFNILLLAEVLSYSFRFHTSGCMQPYSDGRDIKSHAWGVHKVVGGRGSMMRSPHPCDLPCLSRIEKQVENNVSKECKAAKQSLDAPYSYDCTLTSI